MSARRRWKQRPKRVDGGSPIVFGSSRTTTARAARRQLADVVRKHGYDVVGWEPLAGGGIAFLIDRVAPAVR